MEVKETSEEKETFCKNCKWYDKSTERTFHRKVGKRDEKGERTVITEIRAICRNAKSSAYCHLVMSQGSKRNISGCFEKGVYTVPKKEEQKPKKETKKKKRKKEPSQSNETITENLDNAIKKLEKTGTFKAQNPLNGQTKTFMRKNNRFVVVKA
jgi:hypothetical protein